MARTAIPLADLVANGSIADPTYAAADATNGMKVVASEPERIILHVKNADTADKTVTIKAGANPPAWRSGLGDLAVNVVAGTNRFIGPFESARFEQVGNEIWIDFSAATSVTVAAYRWPVNL